MGRRRAGLFSGVYVLLLFVAVFGVVLNVPVASGSGTIYIRADGSIAPPTAPISTVDNVTYTFTDNISSDADGITVERSNITIDGNGYKLQGSGSGNGFYLSGIDYWNRLHNVTIKRTNIKGFSLGIYLVWSGNITISGNNLADNSVGIYIFSSDNNVVSGNIIANNNGGGIDLWYSSGNVISENDIMSNRDCGLYLYMSSFNSFSSNNITSNGYGGIYGGVYMTTGAENNTFSYNNVTNNRFGVIGQFSSSFNTFLGNHIANNSGSGIEFDGLSHHNSLYGNNITNNNEYGIFLGGSSNTVHGNNITNNGYGISLGASNSTISENRITNNSYYGIKSGGSNNNISANNIATNNDGIWLESSSGNSIVGNNVTENKYNGIFLYRSSNNTISENKIAEDTEGAVYLELSSYNTVSKNNITSSIWSITVYLLSSFNTISENNIISNSVGLWLYSASNNNTINGNNITNNNLGIRLQSNNNIISGNNITNNMYYGAEIDSCSNNKFYHNNFLNNSQHVYVPYSGYANVWDDGYPSGGNYWSDYSGVDANGDGIGDTAYVIDTHNQDRYPLMHPWSSLPKEAPWPMFHQNARRTGLSPHSTSNNAGHLLWTFAMGWVYSSSPAIGVDGTIYVGSWDNYLYAVNRNGTLKWKFATGDLISSSPAIDAEGNIYILSGDGYLYAVRPDGTLFWKYEHGADYLGSTSSPAIGADGTIYFGVSVGGGNINGMLYAMNPNGTLRWSFPTSGAVGTSPAIGTDGTIYVGAYQNLYALTPDGALRWQFGTPAWVESPSVGPDGTIYVGSTPSWQVDNNLYAINPNGTLRWSFSLGDFPTASCPAIGADGTIYVHGRDLYAFNPNGTVRWTYANPFGNAGVSPAIGADGTIFFGAPGSYPGAGYFLYAVRPDGALRWEVALDEGYGGLMSPAIGDDGTVYVGSYTGLHAIGGVRESVPPVTLDDYDGSWHTSDFTITLTAVDDLSGVADTFYRINEGLTRTIRADGQPLITSEGTNNQLEYWSVDNDGNEELPHKILTEIKLDKTAPTGSITINNDTTYTTSTSVTLTLTASDATSGVYQMRFSNDGITWTDWEAYTTSKSWTLPPGDGTKTVYYQIKDNAGLISETYTDTIVLDTTIPNIETPTREPADNIQPDQSVKVSVNVTDAISQVKNVTLYYTINDGETWTDLPMNHTVSNLYEATIPPQQAGTTVRFKIVAYDHAGNNRTLDGAEPYCVYQVVPEFPLSLFLPLFMIITLMAVIAYKRKHPPL